MRKISLSESQLRRIVRKMVSEGREEQDAQAALTSHRRERLMRRPLPRGTVKIAGALEKLEGENFDKPDIGRAVIARPEMGVRPNRDMYSVDGFLEQFGLSEDEAFQFVDEYSDMTAASLRVYEREDGSVAITVVHPNR
jgi:hypothetical protein